MTLAATQTTFDFTAPVITDRVVAEDWMYEHKGIETYTVGSHQLWRVAGLRQLKDGRFNGLECNIMPSEYPEPDHSRQRLVVACGMGTDSVAMLLLLYARGIRPDVVQWADTGSERKHTYRYVQVIQAWLKSVGWPPLLIVRKRCPQAGHRSLFEQLWNTEQLPSPAFFQNHSCSVKWKLDPQRDWHKRCPWMFTPYTTAIGFDAAEAGTRKGVKEAIGFDATEADGRKSTRYSVDKSGDYEAWFPLAEAGLDRQGCVDLIAEHGLPQPGKSACFACPMSTLCELRTMGQEEPENLAAAVDLENRFRSSKNYQGGTVEGLGVSLPGRDRWAEAVSKDYGQAENDAKVGLAAGELPAAQITADAGSMTYQAPQRKRA